MVGGSDVTNDKTAEIFTPPHLAIGPRPAILDVNDNVLPGAKLRVRYQSADKVVKALLLRTGATTHSMAFGERVGWGRSCLLPAACRLPLPLPEKVP